MLASSLLRAIGPCGKATRSPTTRAEWLAVRYPTAGTFLKAKQLVGVGRRTRVYWFRAMSLKWRALL